MHTCLGAIKVKGMINFNFFLNETFPGLQDTLCCLISSQQLSSGKCYFRGAWKIQDHAHLFAATLHDPAWI